MGMHIAVLPFYPSGRNEETSRVSLANPFSLFTSTVLCLSLPADLDILRSLRRLSASQLLNGVLT